MASRRPIRSSQRPSSRPRRMCRRLACPLVASASSKPASLPNTRRRLRHRTRSSPVSLVPTNPALFASGKTAGQRQPPSNPAQASRVPQAPVLRLGSSKSRHFRESMLPLSDAVSSERGQASALCLWPPCLRCGAAGYRHRGSPRRHKTPFTPNARSNQGRIRSILAPPAGSATGRRRKRIGKASARKTFAPVRGQIRHSSRWLPTGEARREPLAAETLASLLFRAAGPRIAQQFALRGRSRPRLLLCHHRPRLLVLDCRVRPARKRFPSHLSRLRRWRLPRRNRSRHPRRIPEPAPASPELISIGALGVSPHTNGGKNLLTSHCLFVTIRSR